MTFITTIGTSTAATSSFDYLQQKLLATATSATAAIFLLANGSEKTQHRDLHVILTKLHIKLTSGTSKDS